MMMPIHRYELTDEQWNQIKDCFPKKNVGRPSIYSNRIMFNTMPLLEQIDLAGINVIADKVYGSIEIIEYIEENGDYYAIPPKSSIKEPWEVEFGLYKERHVIECFFNKLKYFRHIAIRFDKLASSFLAFVKIATIFILTKSFEDTS